MTALKRELLKKIENIINNSNNKEFLVLENSELLTDNKKIVEFFYFNSDKETIIDIIEELYYLDINIFDAIKDDRLKKYIISYIDKNQLYWIYNCYTKSYIEVLYNDLINNNLDEWELETLEEINKFL